MTRSCSQASKENMEARGMAAFCAVDVAGGNVK
jgi:hypothetical protein